MKIQYAKVHPFEIEQLACKIIGLDYDEIDADTDRIESEIMETLHVDLEDFHKIVALLLPLVQIAESPITKELYKGFADEDNKAWLVKTKVE